MDIAHLSQRFGDSLNSLSSSFAVELSSDVTTRLTNYFRVLSKWNTRLHLVAPCAPEEFAERHVLESLMIMKELTPQSHVADIGSGGGLPMIPNLIARSDVSATLIESSERKAVFLREALKETQTVNQARVVVERFEQISAPEVQFITCRALDGFKEMLPQIISWAPQESVLLLFGGPTIETKLGELKLAYSKRQVPLSEKRFLFQVRRD